MTGRAITRVRLCVIFLLMWVVPYGYADSPLDAYRSDYYTDAFEAVSAGVAFEPYSGIQRGALGTAQVGSGNALDQALLLVEALKGAVHAARIAEGRLSDDALVQLLGSTSPATEVNIEIDRAQLYDPVNDSVLQKIVREHAWVEVQVEPGASWQALDPSFPNAQPGQSFATARKTYKAPPSNRHQRLTVKLMQKTAAGRIQKLGQISGNVADLAAEPMSLVVRGIPQFEPIENDGSKKVRSGGGLLEDNPGALLGGGLGGPKSRESVSESRPAQEIRDPQTARSKHSRARVGVEYRRELSYGGRRPKALKPTFVTTSDRDAQIAREWLEFELRVPGTPMRTIERDLFIADAYEPTPAEVRRYSIAVIAGEVTRGAFDLQHGQLGDGLVSRTREALATLDIEADVDGAAQSLMELEASHALTPHLVNLAFALESDAMSARLANRAGVRVVRDLPRLLISSVETRLRDGNVETQLALDLRLDEVTAQPLAGMPPGAAMLFQRARGMQESALEGQLLARFLAQPDRVVTTTRVMDAAQRQGHALVMLTSANDDPASVLTEATDEVIARMRAALKSGHQVIAPVHAARIDNRDRWGWWDVNPTTGAFVGVMESGQHQAMAQYSLTLEKVGVNDAMGYVIGALTGSTATMTLYSAKMLEYGQITPELIQEVAAGIERLTCVTCPSVNVVVSPIAASASFESTCFEQTGVSIGTGAGLSGSVSFCENYKLGISCAASLLLGTFNIEGSVDIGPNVDLDLGPLSCE